MVQHSIIPLPPVEQLRLVATSIAMLDAILSPEWEYRYYSYNAQWDKNQEMASMRNGSGDHFFILFQPEGAIIKGYRVDAPIQELRQRNDIFKEVPVVFSGFLSEPAFMTEESTFCIWRTHHDTSWWQGSMPLLATPKPDGAQELLSILDGQPSTYQKFVEAYYERPINIDVISYIYHHKPLTEEVVQQLNPNISLANVQEDIEEIIYPRINNG